uniref:Uncharacterized protein n=1 Tax=Zea mays TaxID=4577 RepID=C0P9M5_MAIZE|nr:unknown [Zea mays]
MCSFFTEVRKDCRNPSLPYHFNSWHPTRICSHTRIWGKNKLWNGILQYITASLMIETFPQFECHCSATQVFGTNRRFTTATLIRTTCISGNVHNLSIPGLWNFWSDKLNVNLDTWKQCT